MKHFLLLIRKITLTLVFLFVAVVCGFSFEKQENQPIEVNGDKVEYIAAKNMVTAEGKVEIIYGTTVLHCDSITANTLTKEVYAKGHVVLKDEKSETIEGDAAFFNFDTKTGKIIKGKIYAAPYYGTAPIMDKFPNTYLLRNAQMTTCNHDKPHYHLFAKEVKIRPNEYVRAKNVVFIAGTSTPVLFLPSFTQNLKDRSGGFSFTPGKSREWGMYLLTAYSYYLTDHLKGILRLDYRGNKGLAWGTDVEADSSDFGSAIFKYYQVHESLRGAGQVEPFFKHADRYKFEYRHQWQVDETNSVTMDFSSYSDVNFLKDYFLRQYEKDSQPRSYMLYTHTYSNAVFSTLFQKRINHFYTQLEKLPEVKLETTDQKILDTPFYYLNQSSLVNLHYPTAYSNVDPNTIRADTYNKLSYPFKFAFINFNPYVGMRNSFYSRDNDGAQSINRTVFYSGSSVSTKFYKTFKADVDYDFIQIQGLRHIITPSAGYEYIHPPTLPSTRLTAFDEIDTISRKNRAVPAIENKLQTKRDGQTVDFARFLVQLPYDIKLKGRGGRFEDMYMELEMLPNSCLQLKSDAYVDMQKHAFRTGNIDMILKLNHETSLSTGYRYSKPDNSKQLTVSFDRKLTPKWTFRMYQRFELTADCFNDALLEQEYGVVRNLHCWDVEFSFNKKQQHGITMWFTFRLKAFPESGFRFKTSYTPPRTQETTQ